MGQGLPLWSPATNPSIEKLCAMGGISLEDFTQSVAVRSLPPRGYQEGGQGQGLGAGI
jgi:hypothetical protein